MSGLKNGSVSVGAAAVTSGMGVDALNWVPNMEVAMEACLETDAICEASICYTGDITNPSRTKYSLGYYVELAKELEKLGALRDVLRAVLLMPLYEAKKISLISLSVSLCRIKSITDERRAG